MSKKATPKDADCLKAITRTNKQGQCELCQRQNITVTKHHLIPQSEHARILKKQRKLQTFNKNQMTNRIAWLCRHCHSQVHAVLSNQELAYQFNTVEKLLTVSELRKFANWIANKPNSLRVSVKKQK